MDISSVKIESFKGLRLLDVDLKEITVIVGGNNSGKTSFLHGVHFAITALQSAKIFSTSAGPATTLSSDQFVFKPADDPTRLYYESNMTQRSGPKFQFTYSTDGSTLSTFDLSLKRGKNANISLDYDKSSPFFIRASDRRNPFSIFVPGLAGVALREERRNEAVITTGTAQGDSNLYLRNVLLTIINDPEKLAKFHQTIQSIFTGLTISSDYDEYRHQYIPIWVSIDGNNLSLETVGTGCLQAIQLVAYAIVYDPEILLLDEPDSHLHPSNQRLLADTLLTISHQFGTKIILSTHSRHILDSLRNFEECQVI